MSKEIREILEQAGASVSETARVLNLSEEGVRDAIRRGSIPATRIGPKTTRVPTSWLRKVLAVEA
jgi:excisionase family DNA binding protein